MSKSGFILFELAIVLALIAVLFFFSTRVALFQQGAQAHQEIDRLYLLMVYLQRRAVLDQKCYTLVFNTERRSYTADGEHFLASGLMFGAQKGALGPPSHPADPIEKPITWRDSKITFYPGKVGKTSSGAVYITDSKKTCSYALTCDAAEGSRIRRYRYDGRWVLVA